MLVFGGDWLVPNNSSEQTRNWKLHSASPSLQHAVVTKIYTDPQGQTNDIVKYKIEKFTIHPDFSPVKQFPDLAILKLTKDMTEKYFSSRVEKFYPQESPGAYLLKVRTLKHPNSQIQIFIVDLHK